MNPETPFALTISCAGGGLDGSFSPPGDKSITHRAYLLGALAEGETVVENPNPGADCESTLRCLEALGVEVRRAEGKVTLRGRAMRLDAAAGGLDCGNSGTTLRLLAGPLAAQPFRSVLTGDASLRRRPVDRVIEPLRRMGARLHARDDDRVPPLEIHGGALVPIRHRVERNSAQVASCVLLAGLWAPGTTTVEIGPARDHTERMLPAFGVPVTWEDASGTPSRRGRSVTGPAFPRATRLRVPGDFSAAAFFLAGAAATPGARLTALGVGLNPTRTGLLPVLERMGATIELAQLREEGGEPVGDVTLIGPDRLTASDIPAEAVPTLIDEVPAWAIAAALARGTSRISGASELRLKESDRLKSLARNLKELGFRVEETLDGLAIEGGEPPRLGTLDDENDHRIAMALAVLLSRTVSGGIIQVRPEDIATSYPRFIDDLRALGVDCEFHAPGQESR